MRTEDSLDVNIGDKLISLCLEGGVAFVRPQKIKVPMMVPSGSEVVVSVPAAGVQTSLPAGEHHGTFLRHDHERKDSFAGRISFHNLTRLVAVSQFPEGVWITIKSVGGVAQKLERKAA